MHRVPPGTCLIAVLLATDLVAWAVAQQISKAAVSETDAYKNAQGPLYHTSDDIHRILSKLANVSAFSIPDTSTARSHRAFRVVNRAGNTAEQQLPTVFIICNQHARELITAEVCMWLVRLLAGDTTALLEWPEFAQTGRGAVLCGKGTAKIGNRMNVRKFKDWVSGLTSKLNFEVVPVVNIDGRNFIANTAAFAQRKNMAEPQVDLNRNWPVHRAQPGSGANELLVSGEEYQGRTSLSEWETRSLYSYLTGQLQQQQRAMFVDVHSGMWALMAPWGGKFDLKDIPAAFITRTQRMFDQVQAAFQNTAAGGPTTGGIAAGPGSGMLYASQGSVDDTALKALGFSKVLTVEVYGPKAGWDSGWGFSCPSLAQCRAVCTDANRCANTVCSNKDGTLMFPGPSRKRDVVSAGYGAGQLNHTQQQQQLAGQQQQQSADVSAAAADGEVAATAQAFANINLDPYMSLLGAASSVDAETFKFFNPHTPALYREVVARWLAGLLFAFDEVANQLRNN